MPKTKPKPAHTAELLAFANEFPTLIEALELEMQALSDSMDDLKSAGLIYATEHWRKDAAGAPKYFYLNYPQQPGEARKREYVGCDEAKIEEARAGIVRANEYDALNKKFSALMARVTRIKQAMQEAHSHLMGKPYYSYRY